MRVQALSVCESLAVSKNDKVFYAVGRGKEIGIYDSWRKCKAQIQGFSNAKFKKFNSSVEAENFVNFWKNYSVPVKQSSVTENAIVPKENIYKALQNEPLLKIQSTTAKKTKSCEKKDFTQSSSESVKIPSPSSSQSKLKTDSHQENVDLLPLNFMLDSFKKGFDSCLKDVRAMSSAISNLKGDIQLLRNALKCDSALGSVTTTKSKRSQTAKKTDANLEECVEKKTKTRTTGQKKLSNNNTLNSAELLVDEKNLESPTSKSKNKKDGAISFTFDEKDPEYVKVYTDGAATSKGENGAQAGLGVWFGENHPLNLSQSVVGSPTSNLAEIQAARMAIILANKAGIKKLKIFTDSSFLINCVTKWFYTWKRNNWILKNGKPVKHKIELEKLLGEASKIEVQWEKVAGHAGIKGNVSADRLASKGIVEVKRLAAASKSKKISPKTDEKALLEIY